MIAHDEIRAIRGSCDEDFIAVCDAALAGDASALDDVEFVRDLRKRPPCPPRLPNLLIFGGVGGYGETPTERPVQTRQRVSGTDVPYYEEIIPLTDAIWGTGEYNPRTCSWAWRHW